jgi:pyruvate formate lyase activating enzyme
MYCETSSERRSEGCRPLIVDVKRGSLDDGPGIRSVVFFKGCPLRCVFCHNPEAQKKDPEIAFTRERCIHCGHCAEVCSRSAINARSPSRVDRNRCDLCGRCQDVCPAGALRIIGEYWPVDKLVELLLRDVVFYRHSGGGVTLSGGECTLFPDYVETLLRKLKAFQIHVTVETCGLFDYPVFAQKILPFVDLILFDLKLMDCGDSVRHTGKPNNRILENLQALWGDGRAEIRPRVPLIPGITDTPANLAAIVNRLCELGASNLCVLPYNPLGLGGHARLGRPLPDLPTAFTKPERERQVIDNLKSIIAAAARQESTVQP